MNQHRVKQLPPQPALCRLKCTQCRDCLSCDPVRILPNNDVLCGRCSRSHLASVQAVRSVAFEDVAQYFIFPCKYDKCNRPLERDAVIPHELKCEFGLTGCCSCWRRCTTDNYPTLVPKGVYYIQANDRTHELITCAHCFGYLSAAPIFLRPNGTYICYRCGPDLQAPPVIRDKPLEALLDYFILKCSYRMNGCQVRCKFGQEIIEHEAVCNYNPQKQIMQAPPPAAHAGGHGGAGGKIKGVIATIASGHIYATITPNHFNQYQKQLDEGMRTSQMIPRLSTTPSDASNGAPHVHQPPMLAHSHRKQESLDMSARSSLSMDNPRWIEPHNAAGGDGTMPTDSDDDDDARKYFRKAKIAGLAVTRNESVLYNNVVHEMKIKQHLKKAPRQSAHE